MAKGKGQDINGRVAEVAYSLFEKRGYQHGHDVEDWVEAERIVFGEFSKSKAKSKKRQSPARRRSPRA